MFNYLAEIIVLILKFENIFKDSQLRRVWHQYMNAINLAKNNINELDNAGGLTNVLLKIDYLLSGHIFQVLLIQPQL